MLVLGIESSCDETGAALVRDGRYLLSNVVASQIEIHNRYGGVVPEVASRQQLATIIPVIETAMDKAACPWEDIDVIAATYGPGLAGSLLVGLTVGSRQCRPYGVGNALTGGGRDVDPQLAGALGELVVEREGRAG